VRPVAIAVLACALLAACGTPSADLFAVERTGRVPDGRLSLVIGDGGGVTCDGRGGRRLTDQELLDARTLARELQPPVRRGLRLRPAGASVLQYRVHTGDGTLSVADDSRRKPAVLDRLAFFVRRVAQQRCGRQR
jgi:hypothetical protein